MQSGAKTKNTEPKLGLGICHNVPHGARLHALRLPKKAHGKPPVSLIGDTTHGATHYAEEQIVNFLNGQI
jgi:hypothetical protein